MAALTAQARMNAFRAQVASTYPKGSADNVIPFVSLALQMDKEAHTVMSVPIFHTMQLMENAPSAIKFKRVAKHVKAKFHVYLAKLDIISLIMNA